MRVLSHAEAKAFYDRFGSRQDLQAFYEDRAVEVLVARSRFEDARSVVELGCGTGRLAERLLRQRLGEGALYLGVDVSTTMVELAGARLRPFADRARVRLSEGPPAIPLPDGACDRFLSTYVLDLLSEDDIRAALREARRVLAPGGLLCLSSLTFGEGTASRILVRAWTSLHALAPGLVGGCRPLRLLDFVRPPDFEIEHREVITTFGLATEVLVAREAP
jgi:ubiquinone/menaquinone biosynthesis C-methylase UbiE